MPSRYMLAEASEGFGIAELEFRTEDGLILDDGGAFHRTALGRVGLVQWALTSEPAVRDAVRLESLRPEDRDSVVLAEAMPILHRSLPPVTFNLNGEATPGVVLHYRGVDFLFADGPMSAGTYLVCWRLPWAGQTSWPDVVGPTDRTVPPPS